jgi:hypothetical protein
MTSEDEARIRANLIDTLNRSPHGVRTMDSNWKLLDQKWPKWKLDKSDQRVANVSNCNFIGSGRHEVGVFTFPRYKRIATAKGQSAYPLCVALGQSFEKEFNSEVSAISVMRCLERDKAGLFERADFLAIVSTVNGPELMSWITATFSDNLFEVSGQSGWKWLRVDPEAFLKEVESFLANADLPLFVETPREGRDCSISIGLPEGYAEAMANMLNTADYKPPPEFRSSDDVELARNPNYSPNDGRLGIGWRSALGSRIRKGENVLGREPRRVVLTDAPEGFSNDVGYGSLGWTVPEKGFFKKKSSSSQYWATIKFDNGLTTDLQPWWFDFVVDADHEQEINQVLNERVHYKSAVDPAAHRALLESFFKSRVKQIDGFQPIGTGPFEVYAYTYESCLEVAELNRSQMYPVKIGYVTVVGDSRGRVNQQVFGSDEDACMLMVGRCEDGIGTEAAIHRELKSENRKITDSPGKEWFMSNADEIASLFRRFREA